MIEIKYLNETNFTLTATGHDKHTVKEHLEQIYAFVMGWA